MPKESKAPSRGDWSTVPYPQQTQAVQPAPRTAAIWSSQDDEILLQARASGLNWQPIASRHFPHKTANACRKRFERLVERRQSEGWDAQKLELLAQEYMACRREMWEALANRLGEKWHVVEAKCMEKGIRTLKTTAATANRRASASYAGSFDDTGSGNSDHHSDSGIGTGSDAEMENGDDTRAPRAMSMNTTSSSWSVAYSGEQQAQAPPSLPLPPPPLPSQPVKTYNYVDNSRQNLSLALPMYKPPPPVVASQRRAVSSHHRSEQQQYQRGISIQSMLSPAET